MNSRELLYCHTGGEPDGRPLYAYRLSDDDYANLRASLADGLSRARPDAVGRDLSALFCLYAAEWCRRERVGGAWAWEPVKASLGLDGLSDNALRDWVRRGLQRLERPLVRTQAGNRQFLMTLACEGGLPLHRLAVEGARIRAYFRAVLQHMHHMGRTGDEPDHILAADAARFDTQLAASFRNEVVHTLTGTLVGQVWRLRDLYRASPDAPVAALDRQAPDWRDRLPIVATDGLGETILAGLLADASQVASGKGFELRVTATLERQRDGLWSLVRELEAPVEIPDAVLRAAFPELPPRGDAEARRLNVRLSSPGGSASQVGVLRDGGDAWSFHPTRAVPLRGHDARKQVEVELYSRRTGVLVSRGVAGASGLGPLPWVFQPRPDGKARLIATGSTRHRDAELLVACRPEAPLCGDAEPIGHEEGGRVLYRVRGTATLDTDFGVVRIRTGANVTDAYTYETTGELVEGLQAARPIWRGLPRVQRKGASTSTPLALEVRVDGQWIPGSDAVIGDVSARVVEDDELVYSARLLVVPPSFKLDIEQVGTRSRPGVVRVESPHLVDVGVPTPPDAAWRVEIERDGPEFLLVCTATGRAPANIPITLSFPKATISASTTFPVQTLRFETQDGTPAPEGEPLHLRHLGRYRAIGISPDDNTTMSVELSVVDTRPNYAKGAEGRLLPAPITRVLSKRHRLHELPLREIQRDAENLLGMTNALDAALRISLMEHGGGRGGKAVLDVRRYDWTLHPHHQEGDVELEQPLDEESLQGVLVEARPFAEIARAIPLPRLRKAGATNPYWAFQPHEHPPGSYLISLSEGGWHRCRPVPMTATGPGEVPQSGLAGAMQLRDVSERAKQTRAALNAMSRDADHPDWSLLDNFLELLGDLPAATFDVNREIIHLPNVAAMVGLRLARMPAADFTAAWDGLQQLVFLWEGVPVRAWWEALDRVHESLHADDVKLAARELAARIAVLADELPSIQVIATHWANRSHVPLPLSENDKAFLNRALVPLFVELRDEALHAATQRLLRVNDTALPRLATGLELPPLGRWKHDIETPFPDMHRVLSAPIVLALAAAEGRQLEQRLVLYLSEVRAVDEAMFRDAYRFSLAAMLAHSHGTTP